MKELIDIILDKVKETEVRVYPKPGQTKDQFMAYCMGNSTMTSEFPDSGQRYVVCLSYWAGKKMEKITPNPCWSGYVAYGLKPDGSPNCVPED